MAELDPRVAAEQAEKARKFLEAFSVENFDDHIARPFDRRHLGIALDWIEELTAMVANLAERVPVGPKRHNTRSDPKTSCNR